MVSMWFGWVSLLTTLRTLPPDKPPSCGQRSEASLTIPTPSTIDKLMQSSWNEAGPARMAAFESLIATLLRRDGYRAGTTRAVWKPACRALRCTA